MPRLISCARAAGERHGRVPSQGRREGSSTAGGGDRQPRRELISAAAQFVPPEDSTDRVPPDLAAWLESVAAVSDADAIDPANGAVTLMTLHAAKGLEFDGVAIVGLETGTLPRPARGERRRAVEEERRLCFVGMTRSSPPVSDPRGRTVRGAMEPHDREPVPAGVAAQGHQTQEPRRSGRLPYRRWRRRLRRHRRPERVG